MGKGTALPSENMYVLKGNGLTDAQMEEIIKLEYDARRYVEKQGATTNDPLPEVYSIGKSTGLLVSLLLLNLCLVVAIVVILQQF